MAWKETTTGEIGATIGSAARELRIPLSLM